MILKNVIKTVIKTCLKEHTTQRKNPFNFVSVKLF